jgi:hypothetical protein
MWKIMKQCTGPIGAGCSHIYRRIYRYNPEIHGDLYLYNIYLNTGEGGGMGGLFRDELTNSQSASAMTSFVNKTGF